MCITQARDNPPFDKPGQGWIGSSQYFTQSEQVRFLQPIQRDAVQVLRGFSTSIIHIKQPIPAHVLPVQVEVAPTESSRVEQQNLPCCQVGLDERRLKPRDRLADGGC